MPAPDPITAASTGGGSGPDSVPGRPSLKDRRLVAALAVTQSRATALLAISVVAGFSSSVFMPLTGVA
ncbi:hypothetical protein AB0K12_38855 [Nonomuraea sp. NPDC049419]|uniref:hypothetical protein n=1 Tax=Nonomuraea sp. NPDC049419 TaxID=3155772 RepID=UPI00341EF67B